MEQFLIKDNDTQKEIKLSSKDEVVKYYQSKVDQHNKLCHLTQTMSILPPEDFADAKEVAQDFGDELHTKSEPTESNSDDKANTEFADGKEVQAIEVSATEKEQKEYDNKIIDAFLNIEDIIKQRIEQATIFELPDIFHKAEEILRESNRIWDDFEKASENLKHSEEEDLIGAKGLYDNDLLPRLQYCKEQMEEV